MALAYLYLGLIPTLVFGVSFQDGIVGRAPFNDLVARIPQADNGGELCSDIGALFSACSAATPGLFDMDSTDIAGCLCYSSTSWIPDVFDGAVSSCADYASTALPQAEYSAASVFEGFCTAVGDYQNNANPGASATRPNSVSSTSIPAPVGTTTSPLTTPAPSRTASTSAAGASDTVDIFTNSACSYVSFALSFCNSATPGFSTMSLSAQAPCLCYSSTSWSPDGFDGPVKTCADFVSTADPPSFTDIAGIEDFCSNIGDITTGDVASATGGAGIGAGTGTGGVGSVFGVPAKSTATSSPTTTARRTTTVVPAPASPTSSGDAPSLMKNISGWAFALVFGAVSAVILL